MKHTPGPWCVDATKATGAYGVRTDYDTHPGHDYAGGYGSQICSMIPSNSDFPQEERNANARLIAAAPDLLAACQQVLSSVACENAGSSVENEFAYFWKSQWKSVRASVLSAIAKAEGKE